MRIRSRYVPLKARYIQKIPSEKHVHGNRKHTHTHTDPITDIISDPCVIVSSGGNVNSLRKGFLLSFVQYLLELILLNLSNSYCVK